MTHTAVALIVILSLGFGFTTGYLVARSVYVDRDPRGPVSTSVDRANRETVGPMRWISDLLARRATLAVALMVSLLLSTAATFLNVSTAGRVSDVVDCSVDYNRADGQARDERAIASRESTRSELRLWRDLRSQLGAEGTTVDDVLASIDRRVRKLEQLLATQTKYPYPDPEACDDGRFADDETTQGATP